MNKWVKIGFIFGFLALIGVLFISMAKSQKMVVVIEGNSAKKPLEILLGHFQDSDCGMVIHSIEYASQVIASDGKTWFFHDHGGMAKWLLNKKDPSMIVWVYTKDTNKWIDGKKAWYSQKDKTPMNYGFGAYEKQQDGFIDFALMQDKMAKGENLTNPYIAKQLGVK